MAIPYISPSQIIREAAKLAPGFTRSGVAVGFSHKLVNVSVHFGTNARGVSTSVNVALSKEQASAVAVYMLQRGNADVGSVIGYGPDDRSRRTTAVN
jgi:hypothetical protein